MSSVTEPKGRWWLYLVMSVLLVIVMTPFLWMLLGSLKTQGELLAVPPTWIPESPTWDNFQRLFERPFGRYFSNSTIVAVVVTAGNLLFSSMIGYALAHLRFPGKKVLFGAVLGCLMIPGLVLFIPQYVLVVNMGLANTLPALILPFLVQPFGVFLMRQFFLGMPRELAEAGRIDGVGELGIFFRIYLPLALPALPGLLEQLPVAPGGLVVRRDLHPARRAGADLDRTEPDRLRPAAGRRDHRRPAGAAGLPVLPALLHPRGGQ